MFIFLKSFYGIHLKLANQAFGAVREQADGEADVEVVKSRSNTDVKWREKCIKGIFDT